MYISIPCPPPERMPSRIKEDCQAGSRLPLQDAERAGVVCTKVAVSGKAFCGGVGLQVLQ